MGVSQGPAPSKVWQTLPWQGPPGVRVSDKALTGTQGVREKPPGVQGPLLETEDTVTVGRKVFPGAI